MERDIESILRDIRIDELPSRSVSVVDPSTTLGEVYRRLDEEQSVAVLVSDESGLVGIFTERDVLNRTALEGDPTTPIEQWMSPVKAALRPDDRLAEAIRIMDEAHFRHIPLTDPAEAEFGLVGGRDILKLIAEYHPKTLLNLPPRLDQQMTRPEGG